jgi:hypothetical protein
LGGSSQPPPDLSGRGRHGRVDTLRRMATAPSSEPTPQRLAAIRDQLKLLADYL